MRRLARFVGAMVLCVLAAGFRPAPGQVRVIRQQPQVIQLTPEQALKYEYDRGQYAKASQIAYALLWNDMNLPEPLQYLAMSLEKLKDNDQAAAFYHVLQRVLEGADFNGTPQAAALNRLCEARLKVLDEPFLRARRKHRDAAAARSFTGPQAVDDSWMIEVTADVHTLHGLYAWTLVGGRKDLAKDWIHNVQGRMHRSGAKLMDDVHGRKGVLFGIPNRKSHRLSRIVTGNVGRCSMLRIGTRGYGFSFVLNVLVEGAPEPIFTRTIGTGAWEDLAIPLGEAAGKDVPVTLELVVPEEQQWSEGAFFDYIEFFDPPPASTAPASGPSPVRSR